MSRIAAKDARSLRADIDFTKGGEGGTADSGYHRAAATLATFEPSGLRPAEGTLPGTVQALLQECTPVSGAGWALDEEIRIQVLHNLRREGGVDAILRARAANPGSTSDAQGLLDAWLHGKSTPVDRMSAEQLRAGLQVQRWVRELGLPAVPSKEELRSRLVLAQLLEPMTKSMQTFFNREDELRKLMARADAPGPAAPLLVHGPGGMGKSALIERFTLDIARAAPPRPWAYVDFDSPTVSVDDPNTVFMEILEQLGAQSPAFQRTSRSFRIRALKRRSLAANAEVSEAREVPRSSIDELSYLLSAGGDGRPLVLVLDTFEEVQFRGPAAVQRMLRFIEDLMFTRSGARVVIAGRVPERGIDNMELGGFELPHARAFLTGLLRDGPVGSSQLSADQIDEVIEVVGTAPLSLLLAADVVRKQGMDAVRSIVAEQVLVDELHAVQVQGLLYTRILGHLHGRLEDRERLSKLAHASLALRVFTPRVVLEVLNPVCGLGLDSIDTARSLLEQLAKEIAFVESVPAASPDGDEPRLRHLPDLRAMVVSALPRSLGAEQLQAIHEAAATFYERSGQDSEAVTEMIYHRLAAGDTSEELKPYLNEANRRALLSSADELPPSAQTFLFENLGRKAPLASSAPASKSSPGAVADREKPPWDPAAAQLRASKLLADSDPAGALAVLRERPDIPLTPGLALLEAKALAALGKEGEALERATIALRRALELGDGRLACEAALTSSALSSITAAERLDGVRAALSADGLDSAARLHLVLRELSLVREDQRAGASAEVSAFFAHRSSHGAKGVETEDDPAEKEIRERLDALLSQVSPRDRARTPALVAELAATLALERVELVREALSRIGLGFPTDTQLRSLARGLAAWDEVLGATAAAPGELGRAVALQRFRADVAGPPEELWLNYLRAQGDGAGHALFDLTLKKEPPPLVLIPLQRIYASFGKRRETRPERGELGEARLAQLRGILVQVYYETGMLRQLMEQIGVPTSRMVLDTSLEEAWYLALRDVVNLGMLDKLLSAVLADPAAAGFRPAIQAWLSDD
ncbi:hypothetical protein sce7152 [Sorangium cellulosum So ce56]|uniref:Orc1-like AAA ATPase domain-containing protein n=1 Tax=Sorangium cellulosum (strain So ce56) TaxID=448385 RepID=A9ERS0_SORC5|nr:ATP-binding protein [Sorangium cellulosum]CAN97321.1 hypothetical protein sce7152 [Sorangium cellulosum So ce56]